MRGASRTLLHRGHDHRPHPAPDTRRPRPAPHGNRSGTDAWLVSGNLTTYPPGDGPQLAQLAVQTLTTHPQLLRRELGSDVGIQGQMVGD
ncbi:hypothetical protein [Streptomyces sp. NPDC052107]|uniref:hypothetical protein n=1 Tax=Streptomyces sp. NPDC052107 TaxID=3155632 RepID=UPI003413BA8A